MLDRTKTATFAVEAGHPHDLGATYDGEGTNFALFSAWADSVELCLFDESGKTEIARIPLPEYTNEIWHGYLPGVKPGQLYGYRVHGRFAPEEGHRFNPNKLLLDPYARDFSGDLTWDAAHYGYELDAESDRDLTFSTLDSAAFTPKCVVTDMASELAPPPLPRVPWDRTIFYETHVRGFTKLHPAVPEEMRGTFDGLGEQAIVDYIKSLGVTSVELLPVHAYLRRPSSAREGPQQLLGLQHHRLLRAEGPLQGPRRLALLPRHGAAVP